MVEPNGSLDLWCQVCRTPTEVAAKWSVTLTGKAMVTGPCGRCGTRVVARFVKTREAPPEIAVAARAVDRSYRHLRTRHRELRDETVRRLAGYRMLAVAMSDDVVKALLKCTDPGGEARHH